LLQQVYEEQGRYGESREIYIQPGFRDKPQALNHYLLDLDATKVLKSLVCLATEEYASKNDVLQDEELMDAFFGSSESGRAHLEDMDEDDWDYLLD